MLFVGRFGPVLVRSRFVEKRAPNPRRSPGWANIPLGTDRINVVTHMVHLRSVVASRSIQQNRPVDPHVEKNGKNHPHCFHKIGERVTVSVLLSERAVRLPDLALPFAGTVLG